MAKKKLTQHELFQLSKKNPKLADFLMREEELDIRREEIEATKGLQEKMDLILQKETSVETNVNPKMSFEGVETLKGEPGHTPTDEELLEIIIPLIPEAIIPDDGKTPTDSELRELIKPLIPSLPEMKLPKDGKTPSASELRAIMEPMVQRIKLGVPQIDEKKLIKQIVAEIEIPEVPVKFTDLSDAPNSIKPGFAVVGTTDGKGLTFKRLPKGGGAGGQVSGGGKLVVKDEGITVNENVTELDFVGNNVTATNPVDDRKVVVTVVENFSYNLIDTDVEVTIPENQQMIVHQEIIIEGELIIEGDPPLWRPRMSISARNLPT